MCVPLLTKGMQASFSLSEEVFSDDEDDVTEHESDEEDSENDSSHELILTISDRGSQCLGESEEHGITLILKYLNVRDAASIRNGRYKIGSSVALQLKDLSTRNVPYNHSFKVSDYSPISFPVRMVSLKSNELIKRKLWVMLKAKVLKPTYSPWGTVVVIGQKKDGSPRCCINFRGLNIGVNADRFPIPNIEEILDKIAGAVVFN